MVTGEIFALMTALEILFARACPDGTSLGEWKRVFGSAAFTGYLFRF